MNKKDGEKKLIRYFVCLLRVFVGLTILLMNEDEDDDGGGDDINDDEEEEEEQEGKDYKVEQNTLSEEVCSPCCNVIPATALQGKRNIGIVQVRIIMISMVVVCGGGGCDGKDKFYRF